MTNLLNSLCVSLCLMSLPYSSAFGQTALESPSGIEPPTFYAKSVASTSAAQAEGSYLLQVAASKDWTAARNEATFQSRYVPTYIVTVEGDALPYKILCGNFSTWPDSRQFKEDHQSRIPAGAFVVYPYTYTMKQLVPIED